VRLFLGKSRVEVSCPVYTRSENALKLESDVPLLSEADNTLSKFDLG
jgi:hypothetical protein